jgi:hypothetical protein
MRYSLHLLILEQNYRHTLLSMNKYKIFLVDDPKRLEHYTLLEKLTSVPYYQLIDRHYPDKSIARLGTSDKYIIESVT